MKFLLLLLFAPLCLFGQASSTRIDSILAQHKHFSGVVLVADHGKKLYERAFGYREFASQTPLAASDLFELASISKQFTATIIMMLQEKGKLSFDDPVVKYLDIPYEGITIRHLLTHTSGLPDYQEIMDQHWDKSKVAGNKEILEYLNRYRPSALFVPGERYEYSNTGFVLLASIAEKVTGRDFVKLTRRWIFKPSAMTLTDIRTLKQKKREKTFALGHLFLPDVKRYARADSFPSSNYTIWLGNRKGPGRVSSTAADLLKWDQRLRSTNVLRRETLNQAYQPMVLNDGTTSNYGFGWMLRPETPYGRVVMHTGDNPGYTTQIVRYLDSGATIIILSNNAYGINGIVEAIEKVVHPAVSTATGK